MKERDCDIDPEADSEEDGDEQELPPLIGAHALMVQPHTKQRERQFSSVVDCVEAGPRPGGLVAEKEAD